MKTAVKYILPVLCLALGVHFFQASYHEFGQWQAFLMLGDLSGAELYELGFQLNTPPAFLFFAVGCFLAGRWWFR